MNEVELLWAQVLKYILIESTNGNYICSKFYGWDDIYFVYSIITPDGRLPGKTLKISLFNSELRLKYHQ